ncbi:MAG: glycosyl transferase [Rhodospirillaceae bacterium]|nr:glycosyl transferase [Rhodospirillaceae bacterium]|tara:strand:+ start:2616 stop:4088 length:1473 start_codon:yes stop_codon:yes gene_type:complete
MNSDIESFADRKSARKNAICRHYDNLAMNRSTWIKKNSFFHKEDSVYHQFLIPKGAKILDLGCGTGQLLASLNPSYGVGIDISQRMIDVAKNNYKGDTHTNLNFIVGDVEDPNVISSLDNHFDVIILSDTIGLLNDVQNFLSSLHKLCHPDTRIIVSYFSWLWTPVLQIAEHSGLKMKQMPLNKLSTTDIENILKLSDFDIIRRDWRQLLPKKSFGLGSLVNKYIATLPLIRKLCVRNFVVARSLNKINKDISSVSIIIPCRNEKGNIKPAIKRLPKFSPKMEIIFVEGHSKDDTLEEIQLTIQENSELNIKLIVQDGVGKGDAVHKAFSEASNEVLMILDADLTVPPEDLPKFYNAITSGKGEFINGTRFIYPMEKGAMRWLNIGGNLFFAWVFSWLLNQRFTDTLCGTKVLTKEHYEKIANNRSYFGNFDPFGDFDLIFGATKLNLKVVEVPIRYAERTYGTTQISRFRHGILLLKMVIFAFRKLKAI